MSQINNAFVSYSEPYYPKATNNDELELNSDAPGSIQIPQTDFDPYYSDLASYDSEIDNNFLNIQDLNVSQGVEYMPTLRPATRIPPDLNSEPPSLPYNMQDYNEIPSSPPSSPPPRQPPRSPYQTTNASHLDSLGITHPFGHRPQSSISRIIAAGTEPISSTSSSYTPSISSTGESLRSPYLVPPLPQQPESPYAYRSPNSGLMINTSLPYPSQVLDSRRGGMPDLSPALSDASSISPDPQSPEHDGFSWQPIVTIPRSELTESIIEQQRKPRQKRKSCLPDGVVEEYVGTTETEGVYICLYPNCQRLFRRTYNLRSHIQTHLCDRPYICKVCDANFVRPHDLRRHERCHSNSKPFMCPCGKGFSRQDAMQRHRLREICEGAISSGIPKSPKPRGRPKGRKNTPNHSPVLDLPPDFLQPEFKQENASEVNF